MGLLETLFGPLEGEFLADYYAAKPVVTHGPLERVGLEGGADAFGPATVLQQGEGKLNAYMRSPDGSPNHLQIDASSAGTIYKLGGTVEIVASDAQPGLQRLAADLADALGLKRCEVVILVSPAGEALPMHFDQADVTVLQLVGRKRWWIAKNQGVEYPVDSYFPATDGVGRDGGHWPGYFPKEMPKRMPPDAICEVLAPGSVAHVPRGWWHQTEALEASVSATLLTTAPAFVALFSDALRAPMVQDPLMRLPIHPGIRDREAVLERLLVRARELVGAMSAKSFPVPFGERRFRRPADRRMELPQPGEIDLFGKVFANDALVAEVELDADELPVIRWVLEQSDFTGARCLAENAGLSPSLVRAVMSSLVAGELLIVE